MDVVTESRTSGAVCVAVTGEIDMATVGALEDALRDAFARDGVTEVAVDLGAVTFCDSSGIAALDRAYAQGQARDIAFRVSDVSAPVRLVLQITGMLETLTRPPG
ncbi:STAS domain-containing protein [Actinoplanes sp. NPDC049681]|uniref:STAS domain-containing protein n=1 Tax=Actinoplanes sp. NPDC049681 TaxID=3363905 RepID=UPI0037BC1768